MAVNSGRVRLFHNYTVLPPKLSNTRVCFWFVFRISCYSGVFATRYDPLRLSLDEHLWISVCECDGTGAQSDIIIDGVAVCYVYDMYENRVKMLHAYDVKHI